MATWDAIYLGIYGSIDPTEGNTSAENAGILVGETFGAPGDPMLDDQVTVTTYNGGNGSSTALDQNTDNAYDWVWTDIGNGAQWYRFDAATAYDATITYVDGSTASATVVLFQTTTGETFLAPGLSSAANAPLIAAPIQSMTLNSVVQSNASGLAISRPDIDFLACFVKGSLILTPDGYRGVETLVAGDLVETLDNGVKPLMWVGGRVVSGIGQFAPIRFAPGAFGNERELLVSPQHRMLLTGWRAELMFGEDEVLVPAKTLVNGDTIHVQPVPEVSYHHIMFDSHEVVTSEGIPSESFHPGKHMLASDQAMHDEITTLFPELKNLGDATNWDTARCVLKAYEAQLLA